MSSIVIYTDKKSGRKYAYESVSYYDKEKKQPRNKRKLLGAVDPVTGEIVPTSRKKKDSSSDQDFKKLYDKSLKEIEQLHSRITDLEAQVSDLLSENRRLSGKINKASEVLNK